MRDENYRHKYWKKYFGASENDTYYKKRHRILELESKRIQAIDRKLKNYSFYNMTSQRADDQQQRNRRRLDSSPSVDSERIKLKYDNNNTFLLRDASRLDPTMNENVSNINNNNHSTLNSVFRRHSTQPSLLNKIWTNDNKNQKMDSSSNSAEFKRKNNSSSSVNDVNNSPSILFFVTEPEYNTTEENSNNNRFKVERVKEIV